MHSLAANSSFASDGLEARIAGEPGKDQALRDTWRRLAEIRGNPFVTPEWFDAWQVADGSASSALVVGVTRGKDLIGVVPMALERGSLGGRLRFAGSALGDCFHPACRQEDEEHVAAVAGGLLSQSSWGSMDLQNGLSGSGWLDQMLDAAGASGSRLALRPQDLPYIDFQGLDWDGFLAAKSRNFRKGLWRLMRRLREVGDVRLRFSDEEHLEADMDRFLSLHDQRWRRESAFLNPRSRRFHSHFARSSLQRGWLRLGNLELDGRTIASTYGWRLGGRFSEFQRGYDTSLAKFGPGKLVMGEMMRALNEEGAAIYDQLVGSEDYKLQTADGVRVVETVRAGRPWRPGSAGIRVERGLRTLYAHVPQGIKGVLRARPRAQQR